jgi:hypothetical protein
MKNKILSFLVCSISFLFFNKFSQGQSPGDCNKKLWDHVWDPSRLDVIASCKTVTGVIVEKNADPDGDEHMLLKLDKGQDSLLRKKNYSKKDGNLVIEAICVNQITRKSAKGFCKSYSNSIALPKVGDHVQVTGSYVADSHNGWTEIHPISTISILKK